MNGLTYAPLVTGVALRPAHESVRRAIGLLGAIECQVDGLWFDAALLYRAKAGRRGVVFTEQRGRTRNARLLYACPTDPLTRAAIERQILAELEAQGVER